MNDDPRRYLFGYAIQYLCTFPHCSGACYSIAWDHRRPVREIALCTFCGPKSVYDPRDYKRWK